MKVLSIHRMPESQYPRVKRLPGHFLHNLPNVRRQSQPFGLPLRGFAIDGVGEQGMPETGQVDSDLVRTPGLESDLHPGGERFGSRLAVGLEDSIVADRMAPPTGYIGHFFPVGRIAGNLRLDRTGMGRRDAIAERPVGTFDIVFGKGFAQNAVGFVGFSDDQSAAGVFVDTMDDAWTEPSADPAQIFDVKEQGVDQRPLLLGFRRVHGETRGLVKNGEMLVLVKNVNRSILGSELQWPRFGNVNFDRRARPKAGVGLDCLATDQNDRVVDPFLELTSRWDRRLPVPAPLTATQRSKQDHVGAITCAGIRDKRDRPAPDSSLHQRDFSGRAWLKRPR